MKITFTSEQKTLFYSFLTLKYLFFFFSFILFSGLITAAPLFSEPHFARVSTEQGLSQDSINALLIDQQGFLWIATGEGLNRYDGYHAESVPGANKAFQSIPINTLFQDSKGFLWIGSDAQGVFQFNLDTGESVNLAALTNLSDPNFLQLSSQVFEDEQGGIWIVLEQTILKYSYTTQSTEIVFQLNDEDIKKNTFIRWALLQDSVLFLASSEKLFSIDLKTNQRRTIDYVQTDSKSADKLNSKFLYTDSQRLWIGTVEGLYSLPLKETVNFALGKGDLPVASIDLKNRNIWRFILAEDGLFYIATDEGLYSYSPETAQSQHIFLPTDSRDYLTSDELREIIVDNRQNFWLGSSVDGALYWSAKNTLFKHVANAYGGRGIKVLSSNDIWSVLNDGNNALWVGTRNGLNYYDLKEGKTQSFMVSSDEKAQYSPSSIAKIVADSEQNLWLLAGGGIVHFNSKTQQTMPLKIKNPEDRKLLSEQVYDMHMLPSGDLMFFNNVSLYRYSIKTGEVANIESAQNTINIIKGIALLPPLSDKPNTTLFSMYGQLWEMDNQTQKFTLIHSLSAEQHHGEIYPDGAVLDNNGVLWIAYSGYGLVGLDNKTHQQKYFFNKDNLLPTNSIYGMQLDHSGNIWMSSHAGVLKFDPLTQHLQQYGVAQGLKNLEFNQFTNVKLPNGNMVYGSPKGLTVFDPTKLSEVKEVSNQVRITNIQLSSRPLPMPKKDLNGQHFMLTHEDVGLEIHFSNLKYENQKSTRYGYTLSGASKIQFTETRTPEIMFPKLGPGDYQFSVVTFDSRTGAKSQPATITFQIAYAPWTSPRAIIGYLLVFSLFIALLSWRKYQNNILLRTAHDEVVESENKLTLALSASNSGIWEYHVTEQVFNAPRITGELGYEALRFGISFNQHLALIHEDDQVYYKDQWTAFLEGKDPELDVTFRIKTANNKWLWYRDLGSAVQCDGNGKPLIVTGTYTNVTDNFANQENLRLFGEAFKHTHDWVLIYNSKYVPIACNDAFKSAFNITKEDNLEEKLSRLRKMQGDTYALFWNQLVNLEVNKHWKGEGEIVYFDGSICDVLVYINAIANTYNDERTEYYLLILSDISEQKKAEEKLRRLANFDSLTGLPNRALLLDRVERGLEHANRHAKNMALFFIDLDKFKQVNDSLGHKAGDELLKIVSKRLINKLRKEDTVARLGGDEFVIMIEEVDSAEAISALVLEISAIIDLPILLANQNVSVSSSIGIAMYPGDGNTAEELLKNADIAMYHAKEQGRSNFQFFTQQMDDKVKERLALENKLKTAHQQKRFKNYYQAIVNIESECVEGFEILMRWPTSKGMVSPDKFITVAEELGLIESMTIDAFERAMPILKTLKKEGFEGYLSVNLSARHFENQSSIERIMLLLEAHSIPVASIRFEITESALMRDYEKALEYMLQIKQKGFSIALDDFGTGFSSLKYLKEFPIDVIKVDKSFVDDIGKNKNNEAIILTTLSMAEQLSMSCIAEGIETQHQVDFFKQHRCFHLQGYYFSTPLPENELSQFLKQGWMSS